MPRTPSKPTLRLARRFSDRAAAGKALVPQIRDLTRPPSLVLGVPHGGVLCAAPVARALAAPLAPVWVRKLAAPREPDVVIGAVDLDGDVTLAVEAVRAEGLGEDEVAELAYHAHQRLLHDWERAPAIDPAPLLPGATAIIIDDAAVTGMTLRAAMRWVRRQQAGTVVLAVPVVDRRIWQHLTPDADHAVCLVEREDGPLARSDVYDDYHRISDEEMARALG